MKKALCIEEPPIPKQFTKGKEYDIVHNEASYAILRDNGGMAHAVIEWRKHFQF